MPFRELTSPTVRTLLPLLAVLLAGCGGGGGGAGPTGSGGASGSGGSGGDGFPGTFTVQGTPHGGAYTTCEAQIVGGMAIINCQGLPTCPDDDQTGCALAVEVPAAPGSYTCSLGQAQVFAYDPGYPGSAGGLGVGEADCEEENIVSPSPDCPTDANGCNQLVGDCTVVVNAVQNMDADNAWGHFSGSVTATLWTGPQFVTCAATGDMNAVGNAGDTSAISASGAW
ncbi:MAG TPA: hypothetical protein VHO06_24360 [Polyangia bacterium]|nr:hypothetical protein [Polyangia bacterium]